MVFCYRMHMIKYLIRYFNGKPISAIWDVDKAIWRYSAVDFITSFHKEVALVEVKAKDGNAKATKEILGNKRKHQINM